MEVIRPSLKRYTYITTVARELNRTTKAIKEMCKRLDIHVLYIEYNHRFYIAIKDVERLKGQSLKEHTDAETNSYMQKIEN